jgi:hypothetical protein
MQITRNSIESGNGPADWFTGARGAGVIATRQGRGHTLRTDSGRATLSHL